jgi:hypothetical protein
VSVDAKAQRAAPGRPLEITARLASFGLFAVLPALIAVSFLRFQDDLGVVGFDFKGTLWEPAEAILAGRSPYPPPLAAAIDDGNPAVYPPAVMLLVAPLTWLPWSAGVIVWSVLISAGCALGLWLLEVKDWRVYGVVLATEPLLFGLTYGNLTLLLVLGLAAAWRWRDRPVVTGAAVGALIVAKVFLWPIVIWLIATRRWRAALFSTVGAVAVVATSWALIGFDGLSDYPSLLRALSDVYAAHTQSLYALGVGLGLGSAGGYAFMLLGGAVLLAVTLVAAAKGGKDGDRRSFSASLLAAIALTPIAWIYYLALLIVPLAIYRPRLSWAWAVLPAFWVVPFLPGSGAPPKLCCAPPEVPEIVWRSLHTDPLLMPIVGNTILFAVAALIVLRGRSARFSRA